MGKGIIRCAVLVQTAGNLIQVAADFPVLGCEFPNGKIERLAKFGTVVESCSKKVAASPVWASANTLDGEGGASANFAAVFFPSLLLRTGRKIWQSSPENLFVFS